MVGKDLPAGRMEGRRPGSAKVVRSDHPRRERTPVGDPTRKARSWKSRICEAHRGRKVADVIAVRSLASYPARYLRKAVLWNNSSRRLIPRDLIATVIVREVGVVEWHTRTDRIDARDLPAA